MLQHSKISIIDVVPVLLMVSDIAVFVLKRDVKLQLTFVLLKQQCRQHFPGCSLSEAANML